MGCYCSNYTNYTTLPGLCQYFFDDRITENEGQHLKFACQEIIVNGVPGSVMSEIIISVSCKGSDGAVLPRCL